MHPETEPPFNPLPPVVIAMAVVIIGIEMLFFLGEKGIIGGPEAIGWRLSAIENYAFIDSVFDWMVDNRVFPPEHLVRFVTYPLIQSGFTAAIFATVFILAIGKMVGEVFHPLAMLGIFFASSLLGALVWGVVLDERVPLIGAFPGVYGLIGAYTFLLWVNLTVTGGNRLTAFQLIGFLIAIQLVFGAAFGGSNQWLAELTGFGVGFGLSFLVSPGGWQRVLRRIRDR